MTGFPGPTLIKVIQQYSMVKLLCQAGLKSSLLNAYSDGYLDRIRLKPRLASASTHIQQASGQPLKTLNDLEEKKAMFMDITHEIMHQVFPGSAERFPVLDPEERGVDLVKMARDYDVVLYEFFLTDKAGHNQSWEQAEKIITMLEHFLTGITNEMNPEEELLLITSDHGNLEDLSTKTHTNNPVPTFAYGKDSANFLKSVEKLTDIPREIYRMYGLSPELPD